MKLILLPFAGANKYSYNAYKEKLEPEIELHIYELPGRSARCKETVLTNIDDMVDDLVNWIRPFISDSYVIYGHSMGTLLAVTVSQRLKKAGLNLPEHLVLTGGAAPIAPKRDRKKRHLLSDDEFKEELRDLGGCPKEVLENDELMTYFLPILRSDFQATETYTYIHDELTMPIHAFSGSDEDITIEELEAWNDMTSEKVMTNRLSGHHFFIFDHLELIVSEIKGVVTKYSKKKI